MSANAQPIQDDVALKAVYDALVGDTEISKVLERLAEAVSKCLGAERATVYVTRTETAELESAAIVGNVLRRIRLPISRASLAGHCAATQHAFRVEDAYDDLTFIHPELRFDRSWDALNGFRTRDVVCAPAIFRDQTLGVLQAINGLQKPFCEEDLQRLKQLAQYTAYALYHARLYDDLVAMRRLKQEKARFMRIMVHELKSPVAALRMLASAHMDGMESEENALEPARSSTAFIRRVVTRMDEMHGMIEEILQMALVGSGEPLGNVSVLDLAAETGCICGDYREQMATKGLTFGVELPTGPMNVRFDQKGYHLVVSNLLSNALKYTPAGSVTICLTSTPRDAILRVQDTGIGIPSSDVTKICQEFYRASNARRKRITGSGVGLSGVKDLVERFGGTIGLDSQENAGCTVTVTLPLCRP